MEGFFALNLSNPVLQILTLIIPAARKGVDSQKAGRRKRKEPGSSGELLFLLAGCGEL
jgi:hypothetical protein